MCDYSLDFVASRPAKVGDKLVSTQFSGSITRGFAAVGGLTRVRPGQVATVLQLPAISANHGRVGEESKLFAI
jgi:hypothetical protein